MTFKNYKKKKQKQHQELVRIASQEVINRTASGKVIKRIIEDCQRSDVKW